MGREQAIAHRVAAPDAATEAAEGLLALWSGAVQADWIDYNGHMTESRYLHCFGEATDAVLRHLGVDAAYLAGGHSFFTVETHIRHLGQARRDDRLAVATQVLAGDGKRLHLFHSLTRDGRTVATGEHMLLHVDTEAERAVPADGAVREAVLALVARHAAWPKPEGAGRSVGAARDKTAA